ncbi:hypothetical protein K438DRAFT_1873391 [Mycena galopus ATCC 62051]|nr:hypothetical protein K438DRAFT_1873391 [Mycena galopus ATCC 62051]
MLTSLRLGVLSFLCLISFVLAQAPVLPQCAQGCANEAANQVGCSLSDPACLCKTSFTSTVVQCSKTTSCSAAEQAQVNTVLQVMCALGSSSAPTSSAPASTPGGSSSSSLPASSNSVVPPPISPSSPSQAPPSSASSQTLSSSTSASASVTAPTSVSSAAPSTSPSTSGTKAREIGVPLGVAALVSVWTWLV